MNEPQKPDTKEKSLNSSNLQKQAKLSYSIKSQMIVKFEEVSSVETAE